jgi:hypothetical protein
MKTPSTPSTRYPWRGGILVLIPAQEVFLGVAYGGNKRHWFHWLDQPKKENWMSGSPIDFFHGDLNPVFSMILMNER